VIGFGTVKRLLIQVQCDPPQNNTYYNFTYMDPTLQDFLDATDGHSRVINFCTQPNWLFKQDTPHIYPDNAILTDWTYQVGTELVDDTMKALGDYYGRLTAWYTKGGFIDEYGRKHTSGYEYNWDYTEIFNEVDMEHRMSVEFYTRTYDAVIQGIRRHTNNYDMKYVGMVLGCKSFMSDNYLIFQMSLFEIIMNLIGIDIFLTIRIMHLIFHLISSHIIFMLWVIIVLIQKIGNPSLVNLIHLHSKLNKLKKYVKVFHQKHEQLLMNWV
jgi:hypothetical protein